MGRECLSAGKFENPLGVGEYPRSNSCRWSSSRGVVASPDDVNVDFHTTAVKVGRDPERSRWPRPCRRDGEFSELRVEPGNQVPQVINHRAWPAAGPESPPPGWRLAVHLENAFDPGERADGRGVEIDNRRRIGAQSRLGAHLLEQLVIAQAQQRCASAQIELGNENIAFICPSLA